MTRIRLNLLPILAATLLAAMLAPAPVLADEGGDLAQRVRDCAAQAEGKARLACFDRLAASMGAKPLPVPTPEERFGMARREVREAQEATARETLELGALESKLTAVVSSGDGRRTFTLANGQVWKEKTPNGMALFSVGQAVRIEPGVLGSFTMFGQGKRGTRVTRTK
jgi:hypothetical protein